MARYVLLVHFASILAPGLFPLCEPGTFIPGGARVAQYDRTMKRLTSVFTADYVRFVLGTDTATAEPLDIAEQDKELPALSREVDFVARVQHKGEAALLLIEFQTAWTADMPRRMAGYTWRLFERYGDAVHPVVVVLREGGRLRHVWQMRTWGQRVGYFRFHVVPLWELEAAGVLHERLVGLYPLLPLMRWPETHPRQVLEQSQQRILEEIPDREQRADAYVALNVLSGIRYSPSLVRQILNRRELMLESPVYEEIMEEGRREGERDRLCADVLAVLEVRFGPVPHAVAERVRQLSDRERLEALHRQAITVESLEGFGEKLE